MLFAVVLDIVTVIVNECMLFSLTTVLVIVVVNYRIEKHCLNEKVEKIKVLSFFTVHFVRVVCEAMKREIWVVYYLTVY